MKFQLYTTEEYFSNLVRMIAAAGPGDRVIVATMILYPDDRMVHAVLDELAQAALRGANVTLLADSSSFIVRRNKLFGPLLFNDAKDYSSANAVLKDLWKQGVRCGIINRSQRKFFNPLAGKSHIKLAIINDQVYLGGCNLDDSSNADLMVGWQDQITADWLAQMADAIYTKKNVATALDSKDLKRKIDSATELIIDAGVAGQSLIFETALQMVDDAEEYVVLTCQFFPDRVTAARLLAAHRRGVAVKVIFNRPNKHIWLHRVIHTGVVLTSRLWLPRSFFEHAVPPGRPYLHAKLLYTEQNTMIGSHNYVMPGVSLGTAEIALKVAGPKFGQEAEAAVLGQIGLIDAAQVL